MAKKKKKANNNKNLIIVTVILVVLIIAIIGLVIFNKNKSKGGDTDVTNDDVNSSEEESYVHDAGISYLTGEPLDEEKVARRPVAVMIPNDSAATHCGISKAGVIFESPAEGGITRIMAIFDDWDDIDQIGCIRSARPYYVHEANEFNAILVHYGYSIHAQVLIDDQHAIDSINGLKSNYFYRANGTAPNNAYTSGTMIQQAINTYGFSESYRDGYQGKFKFAADGEKVELADGEDVATIKLYYPNRNAKFVYDKETGLYTHYQWNKVHTDAANGEAITCKNIIFQNINNTTYEETQYLNITQVGSGKGKFFTNGKMTDITWSKASDNDITHYYDESGEEIVLNPGVTYICYIQEPSADKNQYLATAE